MVRPRLAFSDPQKIRDYIKYYKEYATNAASYWANKDRPDYESEWWMHENRNDISKRQLLMIPGLYDKKILGIGSTHIAEEALLEDMDLQVVKIDVCGELGGKDVIEMDACDTTFDDNEFDAIICREVVEHVLDDRSLWLEMRRVLKPGGYIHLTTPNAFNLLPDGKSHLRGYSPRGLLQTMDAFGFDVLAKEGNPPNVFHTLIPMAMAGHHVDEILDQFKEYAEIMRGNEWSYYFGTMMMVLGRKRGEDADTAGTTKEQLSVGV